MESVSKILKSLYADCEAMGASDIHITSGLAPRVRINGLLKPLLSEPLSPAVIDEIAFYLAKESLFFPSRESFTERLNSREAVDGAASSPSGSRYRFNIFLENGRTAVVMRRLDDTFRSLANLGIPEKMADFTDLNDGLVIVTGPTGSGKSTTLATLIDKINRERQCHIITIEDPIEYLHESQAALVNQRQVGRDAKSFYSALVESLRQDPDVILVGEIREVDTIRTAITAAETGHLVFTTLHSGDAAGAVERMVSVFPAGEQEGIRHQLAMVLRGVLAQHLLPTVDGVTRVPACELMVSNLAIANLIASDRINQIYSAIETGSAQGMVSLEQSLFALVSKRVITERTALALCKNQDGLLKRIAKAASADNVMRRL